MHFHQRNLLSSGRCSIGHRLLLPQGFLLLAFCLRVTSPCWGKQFSFIHVTDLHHPISESRAAVSEICQLGSVRLAPFNVVAPAPSFVIATGDLTEFGGGNGWWEGYLAWWSGLKVPLYNESGNHDSTWSPLRQHVREKYGDTHYSFDYEGVHFAGLDSASPCDPRPFFDTRELAWLKKDLQRVGRQRPVFVFLHHTPTGSEFASAYDGGRLFNVLRGYNVVALLLGHDHSIALKKLEDFDGVVGGSTFGGKPGYNVVLMEDDRCRMAYKLAGQPEATIPLLDKSTSPSPSISITLKLSKGRRPVLRGTPLTLTVSSNPVLANATARIDLNEPVALVGNKGKATVNVDTAPLLPGLHYVQVTVRGSDRVERNRFAEFSVKDAEDRLVWRVSTGAACKTRPCVLGDLVVVGGTDGIVRGYSVATGKLRWTFKTGGDVLGGAAVYTSAPMTILIGSADGNLYGLDAKGNERWRYASGSPVYAPPVVQGEVALFGTVTGSFHCVEAATGRERWVSHAAQYAIESQAAVQGNTVYFGAWDTFVYALDLNSGELRWKTPGAGSATKTAARYWSPADCGPVVLGSEVFIPDRAYLLSVMDAATGLRRLSALDGCGSVALSHDGSSVYLRRLNSRLTRVVSNDKIVWEQKVPTGAIPAPPGVSAESVYIVSSTGTLSALDSTNGDLRFQYQVTPFLYVMAPPTVAQGKLFIAGMDGSLTALRLPE